MSWEGKGEKKIHIMSPENGSSSGQVRTVTPLHICRTCCWWTLSKCWWWKLRMVWEILYHVMRCWSPVFIRNAFREWPTMWNVEVTAVRTALCWLSVVKPSHWMAVINVLILWQGKQIGSWEEATKYVLMLCEVFGWKLYVKYLNNRPLKFWLIPRRVLFRWIGKNMFIE